MFHSALRNLLPSRAALPAPRAAGVGPGSRAKNPKQQLNAPRCRVSWRGRRGEDGRIGRIRERERAGEVAEREERDGVDLRLNPGLHHSLWQYSQKAVLTWKWQVWGFNGEVDLRNGFVTSFFF